ncbi:NADAR family protein [uncultured Lamprocystis sp.]|uniref:NADAR family protein n=1 Tax=uncultured Lamprocystis sp. TaxID=543132 RepID=UPI0025EEDA15|nr:NADAR family protein [uncultured Lamprocystis sp.]
MSPDTENLRAYDPAVCVTFRKTNEPFGGLSNMAGGYPMAIGGVSIRSAEALYQACRFPHRPDVQQLILDQKSPMTAKMKSKPYRRDSRTDWDRVRTTVMRWALRAKIYCNRRFVDLLLATGDKPIVENSRKDRFWGAVPEADGTLVGKNVLGRLLMELRDDVRREQLAFSKPLVPPAISDFLLLGTPLSPIECNWYLEAHRLTSADVGSPATRVSKANHGEPAPEDASEVHQKFDATTAGVDDVPCPASPDKLTELCGMSSSETQPSEISAASEYSAMILRLHGLGVREQANAIVTTVRCSSDFSLSEFRVLLERWAAGSEDARRKKAAALVLKRHAVLLDQLTQPSLF